MKEQIEEFCIRSPRSRRYKGEKTGAKMEITIFRGSHVSPKLLKALQIWVLSGLMTPKGLLICTMILVHSKILRIRSSGVQYSSTMSQVLLLMVKEASNLNLWCTARSRKLFCRKFYFSIYFLQSHFSWMMSFELIHVRLWKRWKSAACCRARTIVKEELHRNET